MPNPHPVAEWFHSIVSPLCFLWAHKCMRQVLLEDMPGFFFPFFSRGSPVFTTPTDWLVSYELNDLKRGRKLTQNR